MGKFNHALYSFIYVELYKLTILNRLRQSDSELIESKIKMSVSENFEEKFNIRLKYKDVSHGYSGEWYVYYDNIKLYKVRMPFKFDLNDNKYILHKKEIRGLTINTLLNG